MAATSRRPIKNGIQTALTQAEPSQRVDKNHDDTENQISVFAERQKQILTNPSYQ